MSWAIKNLFNRPKLKLIKTIISILKKATGILDDRFLKEKELEQQQQQVLEWQFPDFNFNKIIESFNQGKDAPIS